MNQGPQASSQTNQGLEMTVSIDAAPESQSRLPKFKVELRNVGDSDLILNLGIMLANGRRQYPNAIVLTITDSLGKARRFDLREPAYIAGRVDPLIVPLPVGSTFSVPVDLDKYWAATSKEFEYKLERGPYLLEAQFSGKAVPQQQANLDVKGIALMPFWMGSITSNRLQFEVNK
jgi:hypothetical protein